MRITLTRREIMAPTIHSEPVITSSCIPIEAQMQNEYPSSSKKVGSLQNRCDPSQPRPIKKRKLTWLTKAAIRFYRFFKPRRRGSDTIVQQTTKTPSASLHAQPQIKSLPNVPSGESPVDQITSTSLSNKDKDGSISKTSSSITNSAQLARFQAEEDDKRRFHTWYKLVRALNEGTFSKVYLAFHKFSGEFVAVKKIDRDIVQTEMQRTILEIEALQTLDHPNICKLYQVFDAGKYVLIVLEMCRGDLFDVIHKRKKIKERLAKDIFIQIATAIDYMHSKGFAHRDLKPENVLFDQNGNVKLIDFNLSAHIRYEGRGLGWNKLETHCGTIEYAAPELVRPDKFYEGPPVDSWSLGVLLYTMLTGKFPFEEPERKVKILNAVYRTPSHLSQSSRDLLKHLLQVNPKLRLTPAQVLAHVWVSSNQKKRSGDGGRYYPQNDSVVLDLDIVQWISSEIKMSPVEFRKRVLQRSYDSFETGTYNIFKRKKEILGKLDFECWKADWKRDRKNNVAPNNNNNMKPLGKYST